VEQTFHRSLVSSFKSWYFFPPKELAGHLIIFIFTEYSMATKDYFSNQSKIYATFRPGYPEDLYRFIFNHLKNKSVAWDCATGNGQVAKHLSGYFEKVYATDISQQQIDNAFPEKNVFYSVSKAEQTSFNDHQFDLITVAQALHWIDTEAFYKEVIRTSRPEALIAVWGYSLLNINAAIDRLFLNFYYNTVGQYWDAARKLVEEEYRSIDFPFNPISAPRFELRVKWTLAQFAGYLTSWSATQNCIKATGQDPVPAFVETVKTHWNEDELKMVTFPLFMKLGRIHS
jgi:2-polyprenyl-3-methyl-5-hydroxy-6-metoxy-1,4-benzoquinol methylase